MCIDFISTYKYDELMCWFAWMKLGEIMSYMFRPRGEEILAESFNLILHYYVNVLYSMMWVDGWCSK